MISQRDSKNNQTLRTFFSSDTSGQMITIMGITLALSVIIMGSLTSEISDLDVSIPQVRSSDLLSEYLHLKQCFGVALNYNLVDIDTDTLEFIGDLYGRNQNYPKIMETVNDLSNTFRSFELGHDKIFSATYEALDYGYLTEQGHVYQVRILLSLRDATGVLVEPVIYSIVCKAQTTS